MSVVARLASMMSGHLRPLRSLGALAVLACAIRVIAAESPLDAARLLAGRYDRQTPSAQWTGAKYAQNIAEIVPVGTGTAYFRIHLESNGGAICGIHGVAKASGEALIFHESEFGGKTCTLTIRREADALDIDDAGGSCKDYCGMNNSLSRVQMPYASKRPIRYLDRLKASPQYQQALAEWRKESE